MAADTNIEKQEETTQPVERMRQGRSYRANVDLIEMQDKILLVADMPGARAGDIDIHYENGDLSIHGRIEPRQDDANTTYLLREFGVGDFYRSFKIGEGIDASKIEAEVKQGVLTLHLPKADAVKPRKIEVKGG